jgi:dienelactone hydrolase
MPTKLPPAPTAVCGTGLTPPPPSSSLWLGAKGAWFNAALVGPIGSPTVAVLVHQADRDFCGWWPYAQDLAQHGVRSLLIDLCGYGETRCPPNEPVIGSGASAVLVAATWARAHGATRVVVVGASMGGTTAVLAASTDKGHLLDAVADLSGPIDYLDAHTSNAGRTIRIPSFFAVDPADSVVAPIELQDLANEIKTPKPILHFDGHGHGWDQLSDPLSDDPFDLLADQLTTFIQKSTGPGINK